MTEGFDTPDEFDPDDIDWDEWFDRNEGDGPHINDSCDDDGLGKYLNEKDCKDLSLISNDMFMTAIFGKSFTSAYPLVCIKPGDPDKMGWKASRWPCNTNETDKNLYFQPSIYTPDESGTFRAKKELVKSIYVLMVDDVGTKVAADKFDNCPPSWAIETSPGNFQYGYIFKKPITELDSVEKLKEKLIAADLCDKGATGASTRWMRQPNAINGRPKYGVPSPRCKLTKWRPELKYTVEELYSKLGLANSSNSSDSKSNSTGSETETDSLSEDDHSSIVINALKNKGLYKKPLGLGKHDITCPWVKGHTDSVDNGSVYFEPSPLYSTGGFKCHHSHGRLFHIKELLEYLGLDDEIQASSVSNEPQKLPPALKPVPQLDPNHLPDAIKDAVIDLADRLQCPPDYLAVAMLAAAGAVVGNKVGIFPYANDESWEVYSGLWGGIVGDPGSKKSPSLQHALKPLQHLDEKASKKHAQDMVLHEQAKLQYEQAMAAWKKPGGSGPLPALPVEPKRERYVVNDTTYQALGVILGDNPRGILALADELSGLLQSLDKEGQEAARGFYLTGWSGTGGYSFDRIGRGSITLERFCLSVFGGFQPDRIKSYVQHSQRGSSKNDGLLQRFQLLVWPDHLCEVKLVDRIPNQSAIDQYHKAVFALPKLATQPIYASKLMPSGSQLLHFSTAAQQIFNDWFVLNEELITKGTLDPARQSHFSKYRSLIPALALLFHLLDRHSGAVCEICTNRTLAFARYLKKHADRIYASVSGHDHATVRILAERLLNGQLHDGFTCRTLTLKGWAGLATKEQAQAAIDALVEYDWLIETEIRSGGRPTVKYALNPNVSADLL